MSSLVMVMSLGILLPLAFLFFVAGPPMACEGDAGRDMATELLGPLTEP